MNGDGLDDIIVGAPLAGIDGAGQAYLWLGGPDGIFGSTTPDRVFSGEASNDWFGDAVSGY